jgi:hypothetical protein
MHSYTNVVVEGWGPWGALYACTCLDTSVMVAVVALVMVVALVVALVVLLLLLVGWGRRLVEHEPYRNKTTPPTRPTRLNPLPTHAHTQHTPTQAAVWEVLTDYENFPNVLPNLPVSRLVPLPEDGSTAVPNATGRVYQEGEQRLFGWKVPMLISAGVTIDFVEDKEAGTIHAYLVESAMLAEYRAEWRLVEEEVEVEVEEAAEAGEGGRRVTTTTTTTTRMYYSGVACPRGPVPQRLVEWQMRRDVPMNLRALKAYAEALHRGKEGQQEGEGEEEGVVEEEEEDGFVLAEEWGEEDHGEEGEEEEMKDAVADAAAEEAGAVGPRRVGKEVMDVDVDVDVATPALTPTTACCIPLRRLVSSSSLRR